jgi:magnesium transporter
MANHIESQELLFLSELLKKKVYASGGRQLGMTADIIADFNEMYPAVHGILVRTREHGRTCYITWSKLVLNNGSFTLRENPEQCCADYAPKEGDLLLKEAFLDRQIVDTNGAKIRRVNDLQLLAAKGNLYLVHVDVGFRGLMRRVGLQPVTDFISRNFFDYEMQDHFISWRFVQPIASADLVRLTIDNDKLARMHPADLADIIEELDVHLRDVVFQSLDVETASAALEETDPKIQVSLIEGLDTTAASEILEEMSQSEAADLLGDLSEQKAEEILQEMEEEIAEDMKELLEHVDDVSGGMMTTSFSSLKPSETVGSAFEFLKQTAEQTDFIYYIYLVNDQNRLVGVVSLRELFAAPPEARLSEIMHDRVVTVHIDDSKDDVADIFSKYGVKALPVIDDSQELRGTIIFKNLLEAVAPHLGS